MTERLGWAVVGLGARARETMVPALLASPRARVVGVCGRDETSSRERAAAWPELKVFAKYDTLLREPGVEAVYISTPHFLHVPQAVQAIDAGKHVLMESPLALSADGAHKLVEKARNRGVKLGVAFNYRFHPVIGAVRELIEAGRIGGVRHLSLSLSDPSREDGGWWRDTQRAGPASLLRLGVHAIDLAMLIMQGPVTEVAAMGNGEGDHEVNTACSVLMRFPHDRIATVTGATCLGEPGHGLIAEGESGSIRVHGDLTGAGPCTLIETVAGKDREQRFEPEDPVGRMVSSFIAGLAGEEQFHPDGADGKRVVDVTCAVIDAMKSKRVAKVGEATRGA
jgi:D-xylose 1-dehydrogenase (NADP+, D-xylono-1,5-lactone-forming)